MSAVVIKIRAVEARRESAEALRDRLGLADADIIYDDREGGGNPLYTMRKAFTTPAEEGETHRLVLDDDLSVSEGFKEILEKIVQAHPTAVFTLFSTALNGRYYDGFCESLETPYIDHSLGMWGCATLIPSKYIDECFQYADTVYGEDALDSEVIYGWCKAKGIQILTTCPMLIQHEGDQSLFNPILPIRRTERFEENPSPEINWMATEIARMPPLDWFKPIDWSDPKRPLRLSEIADLLVREQINNLVVEDDMALRMKSYYPVWDTLIGQEVKAGARFTYQGDLYKVLQTHTVQEQWIPGHDTESLYARIDEEHDGTFSDPIPYSGNMELSLGLYYSQSGQIYRCIRDTGVPVYQDLADLIDIYVEEA